MDTLINSAHTALTERMKTKMCCINDAVGNVFKKDDRLFIVTSKHVADDFFNQKQSYIILHGNSRIYSNDLKYQAATTNSIDIALIEILNSKLIKDYFEESDIQIIDDFGENEFENYVYFIFGFPGQLNFTKDKKIYIPWMSYMTIKLKTKNSNKNFIYLDYQIDDEKEIVSEKNLKTLLPKAPGLSGAFIFKVEKFSKNAIWHPSYAKAVAVQSSWNTKSWLKGSNVKYLYDLLKTIN